MFGVFFCIFFVVGEAVVPSGFVSPEAVVPSGFVSLGFFVPSGFVSLGFVVSGVTGVTPFPIL